MNAVRSIFCGPYVNNPGVWCIALCVDAVTPEITNGAISYFKINSRRPSEYPIVCTTTTARNSETIQIYCYIGCFDNDSCYWGRMSEIPGQAKASGCFDIYWITCRISRCDVACQCFGLIN